MSEIFKDGLEGFQEIPVTEEEAGFHVEDDSAAEWCLKKIREEKAELEKWEAFYKGQLEKMQKRADYRIQFFEGKLAMYFSSVPHKVSKTQESYQLPGGKLVLKQQLPEIIRDDAVLLPWLKENGRENFVKTKETVDWAEFKKTITNFEPLAGDDDKEKIYPVTDDGEIIPGITLEPRPAVFRVEVK